MSEMETLARVLHIDGWYIPVSNDCFAMPLEASRPAKFPYIPSSRQVKRFKALRDRATYRVHRNSFQQ